MNNFNPQAYWEERLSQNIGLSGVGYIGLGEGFNHWLYKVRQRVFTRAVSILDLDFCQSKVIDIGSGNGFYIERWKERGIHTLVGTDLTRVSTEYLTRRFPDHQFFQIDIGSPLIYPLQKGIYDIASAFDVLFHIVDDHCYQQALENIYAILKPGGWFLFSENFLHNQTERGLHQVSRSLGEITGWIERSGFRIIHRIPMFVLMNDPIDQKNRYLRWGWQGLSILVRKINPLGWVGGMILYPLELFLTRSLRESPTTEMMICRKPE